MTGVAYLPSAQARNAICPAHMGASSIKVARPGRLVPLAHHVNSVQDKHPRLGPAPLAYLGMAC